jgi:hypothetical protein
MPSTFTRQTIKPSAFKPRLTEKWRSDILAEGFVPLPKRLLRCVHKLFGGKHAMEDFSALMAIVDFRRPNLTRNPSREFLAFVSGLESDAFDAALLRLEQAGYISVAECEDGVSIALDGVFDRIAAEAEH